jgi:hypothetical protein
VVLGSRALHAAQGPDVCVAVGSVRRGIRSATGAWSPLAVFSAGVPHRYGLVSNMPECFVIMPLTTPSELASRYGGDSDHFSHVLDHLFVPAIEQAGFEAKKPIAEGADLIHAEIVRNLETADLVLCDISALNANVFFEFGIRTALDRPICLVRDEHTKLPFDVGGINCHQYASSLATWELTAEIEQLAAHVKAAAERSGGHSALWRHFGLTQRGTDAINAAPGDEQGAAMRLILDEIRQLRSEIPQAVDADVGDTLVRLFNAAKSLNPGVTSARREGDAVTLLIDDPMDVRARQQLADLVKSYGLGVRFEFNP